MQDLVDRIRATPHRGRRRLVAVTGAPGSGKSTLAGLLAAADPTFALVPMDGFHLDNAVLRPRGLLARKGAPETFDVAGFTHLVARLAREDEVIHPTFDRALDRAVAGSGVVGPFTRTAIVEGNYLLLDRPEWRDLAGMWDLSIRLDVSLATLETRLTQRWLTHGHTPQAAAEKVRHNDLPNAELVVAAALPADITLTPGDLPAP
ncbi:nucleoside/nucleotide kinase family protein [Sulfitobacter alexandrii]|uniref:Nucleoside/nucleotide kinase family protein n=1 Tax=Sulfitobacter alexandrii TaxID=1917485 RepID=A0A1J0WMV7_9RHOB|nr:nucleoside/nucleotide kinase family protein [Sulfitobacter alexandrii]